MSGAIVSTRYVGDCRWTVAYTFPVLRTCERCHNWRCCPGTSTQTWFTPDGRVDFRATRPLCAPCFALARAWVLGE